MKLKADLLIDDCKIAIRRHTDELQGESFRLSWLSIVCLLRAIGHVLENVDKLKSPELKSIVEKKWTETLKTKPHPKIFWLFIKTERDRFLKEYEHAVERKIRMSYRAGGETGYISVDLANSQGGTSESPGAKFTSCLSSGEYKGRSEKEVALEALDWWWAYVNDIKNRYDSLIL